MNASPNILNYDGLRIYPCRTVNVENGISFIERCHRQHAEFWTVYGYYYDTGQLECVRIFATEADAHAHAMKLLVTWPHLKSLGFSDIGLNDNMLDMDLADDTAESEGQC
jgi:hypothetical protein